MLVQFCMRISKSYEKRENAIEFLETIIPKIGNDLNSKILIKATQSLYNLELGNINQGWDAINECWKEIENKLEVDPLVYAELYKVTAEYYRLKKNNDEFYKNSLHYLSYTNDENFTEEEKTKISVDLGVAVLTGQTIYNFGELLEQSVFKALKNTEFEWLHLLLQIFNEGNIDKFNEIITNFNNQINSSEELRNNLTHLNQKIRICAFLELAFSRAKGDRNLSFELISITTKLPIDQIELLIMKAMRLNLIKGIIDEVEQIVRITWVLPRVLDIQKINIMKNRIFEWNNTISEMLNIVEEQSNDLYIS